MSELGFGMMRLPKVDGKIDLATTCEMVDTFLASGQNYFDTAYVYDGGESEIITGKAVVLRHDRDRFNLATKLPAKCLRDKSDRDRIFKTQTERLGTDHIDYYLLHSVEDGFNTRIYEGLDCFKWGEQKKRRGDIAKFGFSYHGTPELLEELLDKYPVDFVQIQYNYLDLDDPIIKSEKLLEILNKRKIPAFIMEPVKGGLLANLPGEIMRDYPETDPADVALRFVLEKPGIERILSGMSTPEQLKKNIKTFKDKRPLKAADLALLKSVRNYYGEKNLVSCTDCRYCLDSCPKNIRIPEVFKAYNSHLLYPNDNRAHYFYAGLIKDYAPAQDCIGCGNCKRSCPQHLDIPEILKKASTVLDHGPELE